MISPNVLKISPTVFMVSPRYTEHRLYRVILPRSTSEAINEAFDNENGRCRKSIQDRSWEGIWLEYGVDNAKRMSSKLKNTSWVYDNLEKIRDNLKSCSNVDIRRLTLQHLYILSQNKSWCLLQEENSRERVRKPDDPLYDDRGFMELIRLIKRNSTYSKVCQDKSQTTSLLVRVQITLVGNLNMFNCTILLQKRIF